MSATPWTAECQASLSITISQGLFKLMSIKSVMPPNHFILCHPFLLLPSIFPIRVFSNVSALRIRWPKFWSCSFSINLYNEYSELIFFRTDWLDLLSVKGTLRSLLQNHSSRTSILQRSIFFTVQLSQLYVTTGKTLVLTILIFDGIPVELFQILKDDAVKVLHSICQQIWKIQHWPQDWKRSVSIPVPKKANVKECSDYSTIALISH